MSGISKAKKKYEMDGVRETEMDGVRETICIYYSKNTGSEEEEEYVTDGEEEFVTVGPQKSSILPSKDEGVIFIGSDSDAVDDGVIFIGSDSDAEDDNPEVIHVTTPQEGSSATEPLPKKKKEDPKKPVKKRTSTRKKKIVTLPHIARKLSGPVPQNIHGTEIKLVNVLKNGDCLLDCVVQTKDLRPFIHIYGAELADTEFNLIHVDALSNNEILILNLRKLIAFEMNSNPYILYELFKMLNATFWDLLDQRKVIEDKLKITLPPADPPKNKEDELKQIIERKDQLESRKTFKNQFPGYLLITDFEQFKDDAVHKFLSTPNKYIDNTSYGYLEIVLAKLIPNLKIQKLFNTPTIEQLQQNATSTIFVTNEFKFTKLNPDGPTPHYMPFVLCGDAEE